MKNFLQETKMQLQAINRAPKDVQYITDGYGFGTWNTFAKDADFDYDTRHQNSKVNPSLVIVLKDFSGILFRQYVEKEDRKGEYEWRWRYIQMFKSDIVNNNLVNDLILKDFMYY